MTGIESCCFIKLFSLCDFESESQYGLPKHRGHKAVDKEVD